MKPATSSCAIMSIPTWRRASDSHGGPLTNDPIDRDVQTYPHVSGTDNGFARVGEIFSDDTNAGRKKSFDIRSVMMAVVDQDHRPLERWPGMRGAETAVVWDAHLGGYPVCLIGIESKPVPRLGFVPADGPDQWTAGTLFPLSSKKVARAINAASNNRPVVILANLSGFDGSPESMRKLQLEYGAEIGRAVVNFKGPMVFCVISRYHGGAYVVFSRALNEQLEVVALEGTYASVIGGAPAAAVVFAGEVDARARKDERLEALTQAMAKADGSGERPAARSVERTLQDRSLREAGRDGGGVRPRAQRASRAQSRCAASYSSAREPPPVPRRCCRTRYEKRRSNQYPRQHSLENRCERGQRRGHTHGFSRRAGMMDVYWLEQTEADLPAENDWLSASEAAPPGWHAFSQTPRRLAAGTLDGETCTGGLPEPAQSSAAPGGHRDTPGAVRARRRSLLPTNQRGLPFHSATGAAWPLAQSRCRGRNWVVIWKSSSRVVTHSLPTTLRRKSKQLIERTSAAERSLFLALLWSGKESCSESAARRASTRYP